MGVRLGTDNAVHRSNASCRSGERRVVKLMKNGKSRFRRLIAPVLITLLLVAYFGASLLGVVSIPGPPLARLFALGLLVALIGASVFVLVERIGEVRSGEEDDLSKY